MASQNAEEAVMGGLRLRKVTAGMEILWMAAGDPRTSGGAALAAEGFDVADVITAVDGMDATRFRADEVLANIAFQRGGVGEVRIDGYRRIASFPRPSRTPLSGIVPRQAFRPVGEEAVYESKSLRKTEALINDSIIDADTEVSRLLLEVEDRADEIRRSRGLSSSSGPPLSAVKAPLSPGNYNSHRPLSSPSHHLSPPSSTSAAVPRSPPSSLFAAGRRGDLPIPRGGIDASLNSSMYTTGGGGGGGGRASGQQEASYSAAMLRQIRAGERYIRSDDVELQGYLEPDPAGMGRETEEAWGGMKSLLAETAILKGGYMQSQRELRDFRDKLSRMNWALDGMGKMNIELQKRAGKATAYKWMALAGKMNMEMEEDMRRQWALEMGEAKRTWRQDAQAKQDALARSHSAAGDGAAKELQGMKEMMESQVKGLQDKLEQMQAEHENALRVQQKQQQAELLRLKNEHTKDLAEKERDYQVTRIQLTHQRDVFHSKFLEKREHELNEKEVAKGLISVHQQQQSTITDLQGIIEGMRELEKNNSVLIADQKDEILELQERLRNSTAQLVETESREYKQKEHFKKVGKENHATILSLTEDLKFVIKRREEDLAEMAQVHGAEKATLERQTEALETQLSSARNDIKHQVGQMARRLAGARILASSMKGTDKGAHAWETQGGRYPGMHVGDQKIKINHGGGGKMADVSKEEIEELKTDLEEQNGIATALQTLIEDERRLQEELHVARKQADEKGKEALDYKMKYNGEKAKTDTAIAAGKADRLRDEIMSLDGGSRQWPPHSAQSLPGGYLANSTPESTANGAGALFSPAFSPPNSLPATMPPQSVQPAY